MLNSGKAITIPIMMRITGLTALRQAGFLSFDAWPADFICPPIQDLVSVNYKFRLHLFTAENLTSDKKKSIALIKLRCQRVVCYTKLLKKFNGFVKQRKCKNCNIRFEQKDAHFGYTLKELSFLSG